MSSNVADRKFAGYVTSIAFQMSLSKSMVINLLDIANDKMRSREGIYIYGLRDNAVPSRACLEERGLIYAPDPEWPGRYMLSEAGKHVVELLKIAGIAIKVEEIDASSAKPTHHKIEIRHEKA